ncbi:Rab GTPase-activating protein 1-like [Plakobranchus ocellatus]|uniref:Rab GTPase-activating protein 1-like n=1 Tax=Plakobranchus ocellatus TaxID=259542 RepID=A0AAV4DN11_9GAST|nr:Rab GTPase-activating protein 1-like [Plakobranchus ocellatus]
MEDTISRDSVTSSTSEEFVVVHGEPKLKVPADVKDLSMEIASAAANSSNDGRGISEEGNVSSGDIEEKSNIIGSTVPSNANTSCATPSCDSVIPSSQSASVLSSTSVLENYPETPSEESKPLPGASNGAEDPGRSSSLPALPKSGDDSTVFNGVTYLGCATVNAPRSEAEIYRNMSVLNQHRQMAIPVVLSVPATSEGIVR